MSKILIVDDDYKTRSLYQVELEDEGYSVTTTSGCLTLLDQIEDLKPDLILIDIPLIEINGLDMLQEIRARYYDMPVILCSLHAFFRYDMRAIAADYYVVRSVDLSELKSKIKMAFESIMDGADMYISNFS